VQRKTILNHVERHRRSAVAAWPQVPDAGLPDRQWIEAPLMDWQGPDNQDSAAVFPHAGQRTFRQIEVRVQRHVEAVLEGDCQESRRRDPRAGPVPHHAEDEQGDRRGAGSGSETFAGGRLRADFETLAVVLAQTPREFDIEGDGETLRTASVQFAVRSGSLAAGRLPAVLGVCESGVGWEVPRPVVHTNDAEQDRTDEEGRPHAAQPLILNWFRAKGAISSGTVEGLNNKVKLTTRKSYGFRTYEAIETALYHNLGHLPEPEFTHKFW